jgi:protein-tyrosine phosphatase
VVVESFGIADYHEGEPAYQRALATLRRGGWPVIDHRARLLRAPDLAAADLVLCADRAILSHVRQLDGTEDAAGKVQLLRSYDPEANAGDDEVPDPWGEDDAEFDVVLSLIERSCRGLVSELAGAPR